MNRRFRYDTTGRWYKGNTHIHSTVSDGGKDFRELADIYASAGYHFLFRTDHGIASETSADTADYPLLWLDGVELAGRDRAGSPFHVVCLGKFTGLSGADFPADLQAAREQGGLTILAHPFWTGNSFADYARWRFDGVEVYNHVCQWLNGKSCGLVHWNEALKINPQVLAFSADDAHLIAEHPVWNGGWIKVNCASCTGDDLLPAIRCGNFYASCGPEIRSLVLEGGRLHLETSPVQYVRLAGADAQGDRLSADPGQPLTRVVLDLPADWPFVYLEIEDEAGRRAWTNNLFTV